MRYSLPFTKLQCQWETHPARKYKPYPPRTRLTLRTSVWGFECASNTREEPKKLATTHSKWTMSPLGRGVPCNNVIFFSFFWVTRPLMDVHSPKGPSDIGKSNPLCIFLLLSSQFHPVDPKWRGPLFKVPSYETQSSTRATWSQHPSKLHGPWAVYCRLVDLI